MIVTDLISNTILIYILSIYISVAIIATIHSKPLKSTIYLYPREEKRLRKDTKVSRI